MNTKFNQFSGFRLARTMTVAIAALLAGLNSQVVLAQAKQELFASPEQAASALFQAVQTDDKQALLKILGAAEDLVSSSNPGQDKVERELFLEKYQQMHRLVKEPDGTTALYIGAENWPFPVPLVSKDGKWYFDSDTGMQEVLFRQIGEHEVAAIKACHDLVDAEKQYYSRATQGNAPKSYTQKFISAEGKHDGLYWQGANDEPDSPLNPIIANAGSAAMDKPISTGLIPFHGYYFRILTGQGKSAAGGAKSYISNGALTGGFAFVAYPAEYRSSGVMTFIVNQDGVVYEKDLGPNTEKLAKAMPAYNPDSTWHRAE